MTKNNVINKDIVKLIKFILLDYFDEVIVDKLAIKIGTVDFLMELNNYLLGKEDIKKQLFDRLQGIHQGLGQMLNKLEKKESKIKIDEEIKKQIFKLIVQSKYDTELSHDNFDFINKEYTIHSSLKYALNKKNMTQLELSQKAQIPKATLNNIVNNPKGASFFNVVKIAYTLNMNIHDLFYIIEK